MKVISYLFILIFSMIIFSAFIFLGFGYHSSSVISLLVPLVLIDFKKKDIYLFCGILVISLLSIPIQSFLLHGDIRLIISQLITTLACTLIYVIYRVDYVRHKFNILVLRLYKSMNYVLNKFNILVSRLYNSMNRKLEFKYEYFFYLTMLVLIVVWSIYARQAIISMNDDWAVRNMLSEGVTRILILSYPLSLLLSHMYKLLPLYQWYSVALLSVILINILCLSHYIKSQDNVILKFSMCVVISILILFVMYNISVALVTSLTVLTASLYLKRNFLLFILLMSIAFLFRTDIWIILMPYVAVIFFIQRKHITYSKVNIIIAALFVLLASLALISKNHDQNYSEWVNFNSARASLVDFHQSPKKEVLSPLQSTVASGWWYQDKEILPTKIVEQSSTSQSKMIINNLEHIEYSKILNFKYILLLVIALIGISFVKCSLEDKVSYYLFVFGVMLLIVIRDVDRVMVSLLMMLCLLVYEGFNNSSKKKIYIIVFMCLTIYYFTPKQYSIDFTYKEDMKKEMISLIQRNSVIVEPSIYTPTSFSTVNIVMSNNRLLDENNWLNYSSDSFLPAGWISRSEFFYKSHDISSEGVKRRYDSYYDFLLSDDTAFVGAKELSNFSYSMAVLGLYDSYYLANRPGCKHVFTIIAKSENFSLSKMKIECGDKNDNV